MYIEELNKVLESVFKNLGYDIQPNFTVSNRPDLCDYQSNDIFKIAKQYHKNPIEVGNQVAEKLNNLKNKDKYFSNIEFVKPGFINVKLSDKFINKYVKLTDKDIKKTVTPSKKETYVIDYGGPNVAKPLHVGHMRTAVIGESTKRIIQFFGNKVIGDIHLGDYGLQIGEVIYAIERDKKELKDLDVNYMDKVYPEMSALCDKDEKVKADCAEIAKELQDGNSKYQKIWKKICEISKADMKRIYDYLDVHFDLWYGESDAYPYLPEGEKMLKPYLVESNGALIVNVKRDTDKDEVPPLLFKKTNGAYLYTSTDVGTIVQRMKDFNPDHILYVVDARQGLHFKQVFRTVDMMGLCPESRLEHMGFGTVNGQDGKPYKTRNGDAAHLEDLIKQTKELFKAKKDSNKDMSDKDLDIIVNAILKFADLQNNYENDYVFDLDKFSEVQGKTGPYILYTYLRINKILSENKINGKLTDNIYDEYDRNLRLKLLELPDALEKAFKERHPNIIADYVYELAVAANSFYQHNHISSLDDATKKNDWLIVLDATNKAIKTLLSLLAIDIPSVM
jgi:arginyl-tRNA synthetase